MKEVFTAAVASPAAHAAHSPDHPLIISLPEGCTASLMPLRPRVFRLRFSLGAQAGESLLERYNILDLPARGAPASRDQTPHHAACTTAEASLQVQREDGCFILRRGGPDQPPLLRQTEAPVLHARGGFELRLPLHEGEKIYGLGDVSRDGHNRRGGAYTLWVRNVASYVPVPFLMSTRGWGLFLNTTARHYANVGKSDPTRLVLGSNLGAPDLFLFTGSFAEMLEDFTALTGRPALLPLSAYGLTFVCNQQANAREMLEDCLRFRSLSIPCDTIGLEPGWMETYYDWSVDKKWHPERFFVPEWSAKGPHTFLGTARRLGFKVSLWLCCGYDLSHAEEAEARSRLGEEAPAAASDASGTREPVFHPDDFEKDLHCGHGPVRQDRYTKPEEPWFHHLRKFVDQGVSAFKLDGAVQVNEHPDRLYGNGLTDALMHNLYPTLLNKQMALGYREHTGERPLIYSSGGYVGIQRYSATWAGDTGGDARSMVSLLNHGFNGHSNVTCDMDVFTPEGIHFGFLQTWSQVNSWAYFRHPWYLGEKLLPVFRQYARLRYRLLPYIYTAAARAHATGFPVMRAFPLAYPDYEISEADCRHSYMLGENLLVTAFSNDTVLPPGRWFHLWDGSLHQGPGRSSTSWPSDAGGPIFVRAGGILPTVAPADYSGQAPWDLVTLHIFLGADGNAELYEDDGTSYAYERGACARTRFALSGSTGAWTLEIGPRNGRFDGMASARSYRVLCYGLEPGSRAELDGRRLEASFLPPGQEDLLHPACSGALRLSQDLDGNQPHTLRLLS